ncbi:hypothetical protein Q5752_004411 [Cryptotrichosporon argae]
MSTPAMRSFIAAEQFAVIGRVLSDRSRYDNKVLRWYQTRGLPVTPVKPTAEPSEVVEGLPVLSNPLNIPSLSQTAISIIIHPSVGLGLVRALYPPTPSPDEPRALWLQPGAESDDIRAYVDARGIRDRVVLGGPCILVLGDGLLAEAGHARGKM